MKYLGYSELTKRLYILPSSARQPKIDITEDVQEYIDFTIKGNGFSLEDMREAFEAGSKFEWESRFGKVPNNSPNAKEYIQSLTTNNH